MADRWRQQLYHELNAAQLGRPSHVIEVIEAAPSPLDRAAAAAFVTLGRRSPERLVQGLTQCIRSAALVDASDVAQAGRWMWSAFHRVAPLIAIGAEVPSIEELVAVLRQDAARTATWNAVVQLGRDRLAKQVGYAASIRPDDRDGLLRMYVEPGSVTGDELAQFVTPAAGMILDTDLMAVRRVLEQATPAAACQACTALAATRYDPELSSGLYLAAITHAAAIQDVPTQRTAISGLGRVVPGLLVQQVATLAAGLPHATAATVNDLTWNRGNWGSLVTEPPLRRTTYRGVGWEAPALAAAVVDEHRNATDQLAAIGPPDSGAALDDLRRYLAMAPVVDNSGSPPTFVSTGFSTLDQPRTPTAEGRPLDLATSYYFWLSIGELVDGAIDADPSEIDLHHLSAGAILDVVVYPLGTLHMPANTRHGTFELRTDGSVGVKAQPTSSSGPQVTDRLLFPLATAGEPGMAHLRCSILHGGVVLQSRLVTIPVGEGEEGPRSRLDYELVGRLDSDALEHLAPHELSLMTNSTEGSHDFYFWLRRDDEVIAESVTIEGGESRQAITNVRERLRTVSWGTSNDWNRDPDQYGGALDSDRLIRDLRSLAALGARLWDGIAGRLSQRGNVVLQEVMRRPGRVQLAPKYAAELVLPLACFYDYPLDPAYEATLEPCAEAFGVIGTVEGFDLREHLCFQGLCPNYDDLHVFCPGGFWGFRHAIGIPLPGRRPSTASVAVVTTEEDPLRPALCVSTDSRLTMRAHHMQQLIADLQPASVPDPLQVLSTRTAVIEALRDDRPHLAYFFCHGQVGDDGPKLFVGDGSEVAIERASIGASKINWTDGPSPLVFLNGCETAGIDPEHTITLAGGFTEAGAAGVIGTDITVFESMAAPFAEAFVPEFLAPGGQVGESLRHARLRILQDRCNPLGLVYSAYAVASLSLRTPVANSA